MRLTSAFALLLMTPLAVGCVIRSADDDDDDSSSSSSSSGSGGSSSSGSGGTGNTSSGSDLVVATFNAGLGDDVSYAAARTDLVAEALAGLNADVVCLQEVWSDSAVDAIVSATEVKLPTAIIAETEADATLEYDGALGLALLTKANVVSEEAITLDSELYRRGVIYAELDTDIGTVHAFCTQLTGVEATAYPGTGSWQQEHEDQTAALLAYIEDKAGSGKVILLGDMNAGPAGEDYSPELDADYTTLTDSGLENAFIDGSESCTVCGDNPLVTAGNPRLIDHVLVGGFNGTAEGNLIFNETLSYEAEGGTRETPLSDHYGVLTVLFD